MNEEEWKPIAGFEGKYDISSHGRVYSHHKGDYKTGDIHGSYRYVNLYKNNKSHRRSIHQLVARTFHADTYADGLEVGHWDGNGLNNEKSNLRWCTSKDNNADKRRHGTQTFGESHGPAKLSADDVVEIRVKATHKTHVELSKEYGVSRAQISRIVNYLRWKEM